MKTRLLRRFLVLTFFLLQFTVAGYAQMYFGFDAAEMSSPAKTFLDFTGPYKLQVTSVESSIVQAQGTSAGVISPMNSIANDPNGLAETSMTFSMGNDKLFDFVSMTIRDASSAGAELVVTTSKGSVNLTVGIDETLTFNPDNEIFQGINSVVITSDNGFKLVYDDFVIGNNLVQLDIIPPYVTSVTTIESDDTYKIGYEILIQVNFSEDVTVTGSPQLTLETGTTDRVISYVYGSESSSLTFKYTVTLGDASAALDYTSQIALAFNGGTVIDGAGIHAELGLPVPGTSGSLSDGRTIVIDGSGLKFDFETATGFTTNVIRQTVDDYTLRVTGSQPITKDYPAIPQIAATTNAVEGTIEFSMLGHKFDLRTIKFMHHMGSNFLARMTTDKFGQVTLYRTSATKDQEETLRFDGFNFSGITKFTITTNGDPLHFSFDDFIVTNIITDVVGPSVIDASTSQSDGLYKAGDVIPVYIRFNEPVIITGAPQLRLATGGAGRAVDYTSGSGSPYIQFDYTVQEGDVSSKLNYMATNSLELNGGTLTDELGNTATLTLPALDGSNNSFSSYHDIRIDAVTPAVVSVSHSINSAVYKAGAIVPITVTFSEPVIVTGVPQLTLANEGDGAVVNYTSGTGTETLTFNYTVQSEDLASPLNYLATNSLVLNNGSIADAAGNDAVLTLPELDDPNSLAESNITIDTRVPEVIDITSPDGTKTYKLGGVISIDVIFSEAVTVVDGTLKLPLDFGGEATYASGSGTNTHRYNYTVKSGDLATTFSSMYPGSLTGGTLSDLAGNDLTVPFVPTPGADYLASQGIKIDGILPVVSAVSSTKADGVQKIGTEISIQVEFSENVTVSGTPQLTLETGTVDRTVNYVDGSGTTKLNFTYTVAAGDFSNKLNYTGTTALALNGGTVQDAAGNDAVLTLPLTTSPSSLAGSKDLPIDGAAPTLSAVAISSNHSNPVLGKTGDVVTLTFTSSEAIIAPLVNIAGHTVTATNTLNNWTAAYTIVSGDPDGLIAFSIALEDIAGNGGTTITATDNSSSVTVNRNTNLSALTISSGTLAPVFAPGTVGYSASVNHATTSVTLSPITEDAHATIQVRVNGGTFSSVSSGSESGSLDLNVGDNTLDVKVTAQDGTVKPYTLTVTRTAPATIANLNGLSVSAGTLDKPFDASVTSYNVFVDNITAYTTVTAGWEQAGAIIKVNGAAVQHQLASGRIDLGVGVNTITVLVTAEDGTSTKTYTVKLIRVAAGQAITDQNGGATAGNTVTGVVVTSPTQAVTITIPPGTTTPTTVDYSNVISGGTGTVPQTTINSPLAKVEIPASTTIAGTNSIWTGTISAPQVSDYEFPKVKGQTITKGLVIEVGDPNVSLTFTKAVRLVLYGQAGMRVARIHNKVYEEITAIGAADTQTEGDELAPAAAFKMNVGADLVVWTKGFSQFITFVASVNLDEAVAAADLAALTVDRIVGTGGAPAAVTGQLNLPAAGSNGSTITWTSDKPWVISPDGQTINRPVFGAGNQTVTLTAQVTRGTSTETVSFNLTVPESPNSAPTLHAVNNLSNCPTTALQSVPLSGLSAGAESNQTFTISVTSNNSAMFASLAVAGGNSGTGVFNYSLNPNASGTATITITVRDNGGTDNGGTDTFSRSFTLTVNTPPVVLITSSPGDYIDKGRSAQLNASGGVSYVWSTTSGIISGQNTASLTVRPAVTTTYTVTATSASGCSTVQAITVHVNANINAVQANNILSPNGDGQNDKLIFENLDMFPGHALKIFDRSGRVLYQKTNYTNDWEGTFQGVPLTEDTYYYIVDFGSGLGVRKGFVSVVR